MKDLDPEGLNSEGGSRRKMEEWSGVVEIGSNDWSDGIWGRGLSGGFGSGGSKFGGRVPGENGGVKGSSQAEREIYQATRISTGLRVAEPGPTDRSDGIWRKVFEWRFRIRRI